MPPTFLNFNGKTCARIVVRNIVTGSTLFDSDNVNNYQVSVVTHPECVGMLRYNRDAATGLLLTVENRLYNYENTFFITVTY